MNTVAKIHHNLLLNSFYSEKFLTQKKSKKILNSILMTEETGIHWIENITILSYLKPDLIDERFTKFYSMIRALIHKELSLTSKSQNWKNLEFYFSLYQKFVTNIFKAENEQLIIPVYPLKMFLKLSFLIQILLVFYSLQFLIGKGQ